MWISTKIGQIVVQKSGKVVVFHPSFLWKENTSLWKVKMGFLKSGKLSILSRFLRHVNHINIEC